MIMMMITWAEEDGNYRRVVLFGALTGGVQIILNVERPCPILLLLVSVRHHSYSAYLQQVAVLLPTDDI